MCVFIGVGIHTCMSIYIYTVFLKNCLYWVSNKKTAYAL
jgi:hypothetical protein